MSTFYSENDPMIRPGAYQRYTNVGVSPEQFPVEGLGGLTPDDVRTIVHTITDPISAKIPEEASEQNQLADKAYVADAIGAYDAIISIVGSSSTESETNLTIQFVQGSYSTLKAALTDENRRTEVKCLCLISDYYFDLIAYRSNAVVYPVLVNDNSLGEHIFFSVKYHILTLNYVYETILRLQIAEDGTFAYKAFQYS